MKSWTEWFHILGSACDQIKYSHPLTLQTTIQKIHHFHLLVIENELNSSSSTYYQSCNQWTMCLFFKVSFKKLFIYLAVWGLSCNMQDLHSSCKLSCGVWDLVPWAGIEPEQRVLATGPPGRPLNYVSLNNLLHNFEDLFHRAVGQEPSLWRDDIYRWMCGKWKELFLLLYGVISPGTKRECICVLHWPSCMQAAEWMAKPSWWPLWSLVIRFTECRTLELEDSLGII